jgi:phosphoglycerate dehydrogenase-like enzyme
MDFSEVELHSISPEAQEEEICRAISNATILYTGPGRPPITKKIIEAATQLKLIQTPGAGYNEIDVVAAEEAGVPVATTRGGNINAVAEHAIMFMLVLLKRGLYAHEATVRGDWPQFELGMSGTVRELGGNTLGILGLGGIGREVAKRARSFGPRIIYHNRNRLGEVEEADLGVEYVDFDELIRCSDVLSVHVPLTPQTRGIIGRKEIGEMKSGAILLNLARGGVVDEEAVVEAVKAHKLAGAAFDVFEVEPLESDNIFKCVENVMLSPHCSAATVESVERMFNIAGRNIAAIIKGQPLMNVVNNS